MIKKVSSMEKLRKEIEVLAPVATPILIGESGTGKTATMNEIARDYDVVIAKRMSGMTDELMLGIPIPNVDDMSFYFAKTDFIKKIQENKDKKTLLFLDELNRTKEQLRPALFELFERRIDGEYFPNLHVVCALNHGDNFETNWDIFADKALMSRAIFLEFSLSRDNVINYMEKNYYNPLIIKMVSRLDTLTDSVTTEESEQTSSYRSWEKLNRVFSANNVQNVRQAIEKSMEYTPYFFNNKIAITISNVLATMLRTESTVSIRDIITGNTKISKEEEFEILLATKEFAIERANRDFCMENQRNLIEILSIKKEILIGFIQEISKKETYTKTEISSFIKILDKSSKKLLIEIL